MMMMMMTFASIRPFISSAPNTQKMRLRSGLVLLPRWGKAKRSPNTLSWISGATLRQGKRVENGRKGGERIERKGTEVMGERHPPEIYFWSRSCIEC